MIVELAIELQPRFGYFVLVLGVRTLRTTRVSSQ